MDHPSWWNESHNSTWDRVKDALKRDWEQTKHDFSKKSGAEMHQNVADTVKQAAGKEAVPPVGAPAPKTGGASTVSTTAGATGATATDWNHVESAMRYGHGAAIQYKEHESWNEGLENKLKGEWANLKSGRTWDEMKAHIRRGWDSARSKH